MKDNYSIHWKCVRSKIYANNTFLTQYVSHAMGERWGEKSLLQRLGNLMEFGGNGGASEVSTEELLVWLKTDQWEIWKSEDASWWTTEGVCVCADSAAMLLSPSLSSPSHPGSVDERDIQQIC